MEQAAVARASIPSSTSSSSAPAPTALPPPMPPIQSMTGLGINPAFNPGSHMTGPTLPLSMPPPPAHTLDDSAPQTTEEYMMICKAFIEQLRSGSAPWLLQRLNNTYGTMPEDPSEFSYWMALVSVPLVDYINLANFPDGELRWTASRK